jgi:hypothetical protein
MKTALVIAYAIITYVFVIIIATYCASFAHGWQKEILSPAIAWILCACISPWIIKLWKLI